MKFRPFFVAGFIFVAVQACGANRTYTVRTSDVKNAIVMNKRCSWRAPVLVASLVIQSNSDIPIRLISRSASLVVPPITEVGSGGQVILDYCVALRSNRSHKVELGVVAQTKVDGKVLGGARSTWSFSENRRGGIEEKVLIVERSKNSFRFR